MTRLGSLLQVHPTSVTSAVDRLERQGFVERERQDEDRRVVLAAITEAGRAVVEKATDGLNGEVFQKPGLSASQLSDLTALLGVLRRTPATPSTDHLPSTGPCCPQGRRDSPSRLCMSGSPVTYTTVRDYRAIGVPIGSRLVLLGRPTTEGPHNHEPSPTSRSTRSGWSPRPACSTGTTRRSTSCGGSCSRQGAEVIHLGHNRSVQEVVDAALEEDVAGRRGLLLPGRPRRVLRVPRAVAARARAPATCASSAAAAASSCHEEIDAAARQRRHDLLPRGRPAAGPGRDDQLASSPTATSTCGTAAPVTADDVLAGERCRRRAGDHRRRAGPAARRRPRRAARGGRRAPRPGPRHHRHRRVRQVLPHRRARTPAPHRPAGQAAGRGARGRPDPAQGRRRAARRPDPDERPRRRPRLLPLPGHPRRRTSCPTPRPTSSPCSRPPASTWSSSRPPASARATRPIVPLRRRRASTS